MKKHEAVPSVKVGDGAEGRSLPTVDVGIPMPPVKAPKAGDGPEADRLDKGEWPEAEAIRSLAALLFERMPWIEAPDRVRVTRALAAAREEGRIEGYKHGLFPDELDKLRAEAATVPCGACGGTGRVVPPLSGGGEAFLPCQAPGCVDGRVDARLAACLEIAADVSEALNAVHARRMDREEAEFWETAIQRFEFFALAKYGPEAKETT